MEKTTCYDCASPIGFPKGMPEGAEVPLCYRCGDVRRRLLKLENFSAEPFALMVHGKRAAVAPMRYAP